MINTQDLKIWGYSKSDPIVIELETQLEQELMSTEEFMRLLSRPAPKLVQYFVIGIMVAVY